MTRNPRAEVPLPPERLRLMGDSDEAFLAQADSLTQLCRRMGLADGDAVLDVGCGVGRLAVGLLREGFEGRYVGFDVMRRQVTWARRSLTPLDSAYRFRHADVHNARYNPQGTIDPAEFRFPVRDRGFGFGVLFSVFTHFYLEDVEHYLHELHRAVRPGGRVLVSWFVYDDASHETVRTSSAYPMTHSLGEDTLFHTTEDPLRAIAHHERAVRRLLQRSGFELERLEHGRWKSGPGPEFQDMLLLRRRADPWRERLTPRRVAASARRRAALLISPR